MGVREKLVTVAEYEAFISRSENAERRFELIAGEFVESMPSQLHAAITLLIGTFIMNYLMQHPVGRAYVEARYQIPEDEHNAYIPDLSFVSDSTRPIVEKGAAPYMPDLAVEIQSPDDSLKEMSAKAAYYLANGTRMVWLVYPAKRIVEVLTPNERQILTESDILTGGDVLPEFAVTVRQLFPS